MSSTLTQADVARLMNHPSADTRAETAAKIADQFDQESLSDNERRLAEDIFRALVRDAEVRVREALSVHLKACPDVPHDIAQSLARDVDSVALPIIRFSEVLTDDDLVEIVKGQDASKQVAVAQRPKVSEGVADALIDTGNETAVARLVSNEGAELTENAFERVIDSYGESDAVSDSLARRPNLPPAISEHVVNVLTEQLQAVLSKKHDLPGDQMTNLLMQTRERATVSIVHEGSSDAELERLVEQMHANGRLTPSLLLRALAMGDLAFFETAMARLASVPVQNARILIHDEGKLGFESIYMRAGLSERLFPAFRAGVDLIGVTDYDGGPNDRERYVTKLVERMLTHCEDPSNRLTEEDIEYLIGKLQQLAA